MRETIKLSKNNDLNIGEGYERFRQHRLALNLSKDTISYYDMCYKYFADYIGKDMVCANITDVLITSYILHLRKTRKDISDISINTYLRGLRVILYFLMDRGHITPFKISLIKADKKIKETYTDEELEQLLKKPNIKTENFATYRTWVIICYLLGTGNRVRTLCNIKIGDIDFSSHEIKLRAVKNHRQYIIPLSSVLEKTLREYLEYRKGNPDDYLFCTQFGQQLTQFGLSTSIKKYNKRRGVSKTSIHLFRHTFAKKWILNGGDIFRLQKILGHSSLDIVKEYVNMYGADLQNDFSNFNPLDNMSGNLYKQKISMQKNTRNRA